MKAIKKLFSGMSNRKSSSSKINIKSMPEESQVIPHTDETMTNPIFRKFITKSASRPMVDFIPNNQATVPSAQAVLCKDFSMLDSHTDGSGLVGALAYLSSSTPSAQAVSCKDLSTLDSHEDGNGPIEVPEHLSTSTQSSGPSGTFDGITIEELESDSTLNSDEDGDLIDVPTYPSTSTQRGTEPMPPSRAGIFNNLIKLIEDNTSKMPSIKGFIR